MHVCHGVWCGCQKTTSGIYQSSSPTLFGGSPFLVAVYARLAGWQASENSHLCFCLLVGVQGAYGRLPCSRLFIWICGQGVGWRWGLNLSWSGLWVKYLPSYLPSTHTHTCTHIHRVYFFEIVSHTWTGLETCYVAEAGLEVLILLALPPKCLYYIWTAPCLALNSAFKSVFMVFQNVIVFFSSNKILVWVHLV